MEEFEKDLIRSRFCDLIIHTNCSVEFLTILCEKKIFSLFDIDNITAKNEGHMRACEFYKIIVTRVNGFQALLEALDKTKQTKCLQFLTEAEDSFVNLSLEEVRIRVQKLLREDSVSKSSIFFDVDPPVHLFTGRTKELEDLHEMILKSKKGERVTVLSQLTCVCGLGGIGKTQLVRQYISEKSCFFNGNVIWLNAENHTSLTASFCRLAVEKLSLSTKERNGTEKSAKAIAEEVYKYFAGQRALFVFDDATNDGAPWLRELLPNPNKNPEVYILMTSRRTKWGIGANVMSLGELTQAEAVSMVKLGLEIEDENDEHDEAIIKLTEKLQCFPLALHQAISYIYEQRLSGEYSIQTYISQFETTKSKVVGLYQNEDILDDTNSITTETTWKIIIDKIATNPKFGTVAILFFKIMSFCNTNISRDFFYFLLQKHGLIYDESSYEIKTTEYPKSTFVSEATDNILVCNPRKWISESEDENNSTDDGIVQVGSQISYFPKIVLGTGSIGSVVYFGKLNHRKHIAVKEIHDCFFQSLGNEIELLTKINDHPNIIHLICHEVMDDFHYIAMELCQATLKDYIEKNKQGIWVWEVPDLEILFQCVSGLMHIHENKIVHRNLKPSNILLLKCPNGQILCKISDFAIAKKITDDSFSYPYTEPIGSPGWIAPEVSAGENGDEIVAASVDIFSLGCLFYYVITKGRHPFGDQEGAFGRQINIDKGNFNIYPYISYYNHGMPNLIKLMIDSSPNNRPPLWVIKHHPVFWNSDKTLQFFNHVNSLRSDKRAFVQDTFKQLQELVKRNNVLGERGWLQPAAEKFGHVFSKPNYKQNSLELIRAIRNFNVHKVGYQTPIEFRLANENKYINGWLDLFPKLLPCAWIAFKSLNDKNVEGFSAFYGDKGDHFWKNSSHNLLIEVADSEKTDEEEKVKTSSELIVGTPECRSVAVLRCIRSSEHLHSLFQTWTDLGEALGINQVNLLRWERYLLIERATLSGVISDIIYHWIEENGNHAKLVKLENALRDVGCQEIADELEKTFRLSNK